MDESLSIADLCVVPSFSWPAVSPSGTSLAFYREMDGECTVSLLDLETNTTRSLMTDRSLSPSNRLVWDRTEDWLYLHHSETDTERTDIYALSFDGTLRPVIRREGRCWLWDVSPDNRSLLYSHRHPDAAHWESPRILYRYDRETDTHEQLTPDDQFVLARGNKYSPTGERITYATASAANETLLEQSDVYLAHADGTNARQLAVGEEDKRTLVKDWHPDGRRLLVWDTSGTTRCGVYTLTDETVTWFGTGDIQEKPVVWLPDGDRFLAIRKERTQTVPLIYNSHTEQAQPFAISGSCSYVPTATEELLIDAQQVLIPHSTPTLPMELLAYDLETETTTTLFEPRDDVIEPSRLVAPDYVTYESTDGRSIGALCYQATAQPSPAIVLVHGGQHGRASEDYHWQTQWLVDRGLTVVRPNYRGSTGRGNAFKALQYGDLGGHDAMDIAACGQWLRRQDWIDSDRVAVYGESYGAYLTYLQMVRYPKVWTAGIAAAGVTDLVAIHERNPDLPGLHEMGDPTDNPALLRERSPLTHVEQFEGPLLMLHGSEDMASPVSHARRFRDALCEHGFEEGEAFEYHEHSDEGHALIERDQILRHWQTVADFLSRHLDL